jgi:hypothetical protein
MVFPTALGWNSWGIDAIFFNDVSIALVANTG